VSNSRVRLWFEVFREVRAAGNDLTGRLVSVSVREK
jgi:hypothetical protein